MRNNIQQHQFQPGVQAQQGVINLYSAMQAHRYLRALLASCTEGMSSALGVKDGMPGRDALALIR